MNIVPLIKVKEVATLRITPEGSNKTIQWSGPMQLVRNGSEENITIGVPLRRGNRTIRGRIKLVRCFRIKSIPQNGQQTIQTVFYPENPVSKYMLAALEEKLSKNKFWRKNNILDEP